MGGGASPDMVRCKRGGGGGGGVVMKQGGVSWLNCAPDLALGLHRLTWGSLSITAMFFDLAVEIWTRATLKPD